MNHVLDKKQRYFLPRMVVPVKPSFRVSGVGNSRLGQVFISSV